jgi:hypothetical protein
MVALARHEHKSTLFIHASNLLFLLTMYLFDRSLLTVKAIYTFPWFLPKPKVLGIHFDKSSILFLAESFMYVSESSSFWTLALLLTPDIGTL